MRRGRSTIVNVFVLAATLLVASFLLTYFVGMVAIESNRKIASQRYILQHLDQMLSTLKDAETGQRGYLLIPDEAYLSPYRQALEEIHTEEQALRSLSKAGEISSSSVETVIRLTAEKLAELDQTLQIRRERGLYPALAIIHAGKGMQLMDQIRAELGRMREIEEDEIDQAFRRARTAVNARTATFLFTVVLNLFFLLWAYRQIHREVRNRDAAILETARQRELLATTLASIGDGVIVTDPKGQITFLNTEAERLTGWKNFEAANQPLPAVFRIIDENNRQPVENPLDKVLRLGGAVGLARHTLLLAKDGREIPIDDSAAPIRQPDGPLYGVVLVFRDFSEQRKSEEISARLAAIVEFSRDPIISRDLSGIIQTWNAGAERLFGYREKEIIGKPVTLLIPPDRIREEKEIDERLARGEPFGQIETVRVAKDGREIPVSLIVSPLKDSEGRITGASKIVRDISDILAARETLARGKLELEQLVEERTANLQEMINELQHVSYAITHDMRAPLRAMGIFAQLLLEQSLEEGGSPETTDYCRRTLTAASRLDKLISDALSYNRAVLQHLPLEPINLSNLLRGLLDTYPNFHPDKADIRIENGLPVVLGNESLLTQCFSNLLSNSVKFVAPGARPKIRVWAEIVRGSTRILIQDNGIGIPKHAHPRLFGMFQKLDNQYEGTGIGLAIVRKVAERMGGNVGVESEPGRGSLFWVELRAASVEFSEKSLVTMT